MSNSYSNFRDYEDYLSRDRESSHRLQMLGGKEQEEISKKIQILEKQSMSGAF